MDHPTAHASGLRLALARASAYFGRGIPSTAVQLPTHLTIEVTTVCNIVPPCVMCGKHLYPRQGWLKRDASHFPRKFLPKLLPVLRNLQCLSLNGIGEPLTCPHLFEFIEHVPATCHVQFTSNGWLLHAANRARILDHRIALVDFSLDAASAETYRKIRRGDWEQTVENIAQLIAERDRRGAVFPNVLVNMCLMRENLDELPAFVRLAKRIKANHCYAVHLNQGLSWRAGWFNYAEQHCSLEAARHDERVAEAFAVSHELTMPFEVKGRAFYAPDRAPPAGIVPHLPTPARIEASAPMPGLKCALPWQHAVVYRNGRVTNCCWQQGAVGSLEEHTFEEIWQGGTEQAVRRQLETGSFHHACLADSVCPPRGRL